MVKKISLLRIFSLVNTNAPGLMGHGSVFVWVSVSWVTARDPLPALLSRTCDTLKYKVI